MTMTLTPHQRADHHPQDIKLERRNGRVRVSIPHTHKQYSPSFDWGQVNAATTELAFNILAQLIPIQTPHRTFDDIRFALGLPLLEIDDPKWETYEHDPILEDEADRLRIALPLQLRDGSWVAWEVPRLVHRFRDRFLLDIPEAGGRLLLPELLQWLKQEKAVLQQEVFGPLH